MKTIYYNGRVYTGQLPLQQAFAVEGNLFLQVGDTEQLLGLAGEDDVRVDLGDHFVCAGFNDSHMHLLKYGQILHHDTVLLLLSALLLGLYDFLYSLVMGISYLLCILRQHAGKEIGIVGIDDMEFL